MVPLLRLGGLRVVHDHDVFRGEPGKKVRERLHSARINSENGGVRPYANPTAHLFGPSDLPHPAREHLAWGGTQLDEIPVIDGYGDS